MRAFYAEGDFGAPPKADGWPLKAVSYLPSPTGGSTDMTQQKRFPTVGDGSGVTSEEVYYREELQLAFRNRGMPLEGLRYDVTPTGMHYLLTHFDIPDVDMTAWKLNIGGLVGQQAGLSLDEIKALPKRTEVVTLECAGNGREVAVS